MTTAAFTVRQIFLTAVGFTIVAVAADLGSAGGSVRIAASSAAWAVLVSAAATAGLILAGWLVSLGVRNPVRRRTYATFGAAVPVIIALVLCGAELLSGPRISGKPWAGAVRIAWFVGAPLAGLVVSQLALRVLWVGDLWPRRRGIILAALLTVIPVALVLDHEIYPVLYLAGHLLLWLAVFCAVGLQALIINRSSTRPGAKACAVALVLMLVGAAAILTFDPLGASPSARAAAFQQTLFLKRALTHLKPAPPPEPLEADPATLAALRAARALDSALLDRTFPDRRKMNVVVISIDAVRADRLSRNGYARPLTKNLDALVAGGCYFKNAWTSYPFTLMAFASAFAGVYAGSTDAYRYRELGLERNPWTNQPTLASLMRAKGWRTEAVVGFPRYVREPVEREEGFEFFNARSDPAAKDRDLVAEEVATLAIDALDRDPEKPFLLWVHFFDPHAPYSPPPPHPWGEEKADLYDAEILYADRELGRFLAALRSRGLAGNTAIVVFSDHGEDLVEFDHGTALTEVQIHIPLAVVLPRIPPREVALSVDLTDLAPTVLELVGLEKPGHFHGQSLLPCALLDPALQPGDSFPPDLAFCELGGARVTQPRQFAARAGSMKIICHADSQTYALYDLTADPGETRDLSQDSPDALARMKRVLDSFRSLIAPK